MRIDFRTRRTTCDVPFARSSCSHIRRTCQPADFNVLVTSRSRVWFVASLFRQKAALLLGLVACSGQQCQKQPSTKIARRSLRKTKSGLPKTGRLRRQPVMRCARNSFASAISVSLLPRPRMRDITSERFVLVKTSVIAPLHFLQRILALLTLNKTRLTEQVDNLSEPRVGTEHNLAQMPAASQSGLCQGAPVNILRTPLECGESKVCPRRRRPKSPEPRLRSEAHGSLHCAGCVTKRASPPVMRPIVLNEHSGR